MEPQQTSGYTIEHIILVESNFRRDITIDFDDQAITNNLDMQVEPSATENNQFFVSLLITLKAQQSEKTVFEFAVKMGGVFSKQGEPALKEEVFKNINAPAILFPFIREHIGISALKAGIGNILLPPVNFVGKETTE